MIRGKNCLNTKIVVGASGFKRSVGFRRIHVNSRVASRYEQIYQRAPKTQDEVDPFEQLL